MTKYELMLVIDGSLSEKKASDVLTNCQKLLTDYVKDLKVDFLGLKKLAYKIRHINQGYYYVLTFSCSDTKIIKEFNRLTLINKDVLRFLIINLEHNYGYRAIHNAKKIEKAKIKAEIYAKKKKEFEEKLAAKKIAETVESNVENKLVDESQLTHINNKEETSNE